MSSTCLAAERSGLVSFLVVRCRLQTKTCCEVLDISEDASAAPLVQVPGPRRCNSASIRRQTRSLATRVALMLSPVGVPSMPCALCSQWLQPVRDASNTFMNSIDAHGR
eukprot:5729906-Pyramimonas_sp.AAC.1